MSESDHDTVIIEIFVDVFPRFAIVTVTHKEGPPDAEPFFRWCVTCLFVERIILSFHFNTSCGRVQLLTVKLIRKHDFLKTLVVFG